MEILVILSGDYGQRHLDNICKNGPKSWKINHWNAPTILPPVIDYPEDFLPETLPKSDLVLSFAEHKGVAELLPDIAQMSGAKSVLVAVDNENWLPTGLARQLHRWLNQMGIACVTPKPLCSLTEYDFGVTRKERVRYDDAFIAEFAKYFGQPELEIDVDEKTGLIVSANVSRDAVCGCCLYVAEGIIGLPVDDVEEKAGLLHHHYPCLASMSKLPEFNQDTLMHESGNIIKNKISKQVKPFIKTHFISPGKRSPD